MSKNILRINQAVEGQNLNRIETEILRPIQIDENQCTFIFRNKGMLDKNTTISLPVIGGSANSFLPLSTGIMSFVKQAFIRIGGVELASTDEVGGYYALRSLFKTQEVRADLERCRKGIHSVFSNASKKRSANIPAGQSRIQAGITYNGANPNAGTTTTPYKLTNNADTTARFYFTLEDLFPHLFSALQLPLQFIRDEVSLVINWSSNALDRNANERVCTVSGQAVAGATLVTDQVECLVDYLFYNDVSAVAKQIMSSEGQVLQYADLITNVVSISKLNSVIAAGSNQRQTTNINLGFTNRVLRAMYFARVPTATPGNDRNGLLNKYFSEVGSVVDKGEDFQIKINDQPLFQSPVNMDGHKFNLLEEAMGLPLGVPNAGYTHYGGWADALNDGVGGLVKYGDWTNNKGFSQDTIEGFAQSTALTGNYHYFGANLHKPSLLADGSLVRADVPGAGMLCGDAPVQIVYNREVTNGRDNDAQLFVWTVVEKQSRLKMGQFITTQV